jgi:hypothetical protein
MYIILVSKLSQVLGRCNDHYYLRFEPFFCENIGVFFSKTNIMINFLNKVTLFLVKNANFVANFFGENIFKITTSVPELGF